MVTPYKSFLYLTSLLICANCYYIIFNNEITVFGQTIRIYNPASAFEIQAKKEKTDIAALLQYAEEDDEIISDTLQSIAIIDSLPIVDSTKANVTKEKRDAIYPDLPLIEYPSDSDRVLDHFFASLAQSQDTIIRILHYGDSQIEGDRITKTLRKNFQETFGGCGAGIVPLLEHLRMRKACLTKYSENWARYPIYGPEYEKKASHNYGLLGTYYTLSPIDTSKNAIANDSTVKKGEISYKFQWPHLHPDAKLSLIFGKCDTSTHLLATCKKDTLFDNNLSNKNDINILDIPTVAEQRELTLQLKSYKNPLFYGLHIGCEKGIMVDNAGFRGSAGQEFTRINLPFYKKQIDQFNVKLLILQFGINVVPGILDNYAHYENRFYKQLLRLKKLHPELDILVVGVSDMAYKNGEVMESYPNIPLIIEAQRKAAFKAGCAFWSMYDAMGGEGAMVDWVEAEPQLAAKDYTHFTEKGTSIAGNMLYRALMKAYDDYKKEHFTN